MEGRWFPPPFFRFEDPQSLTSCVRVFDFYYEIASGCWRDVRRPVLIAGRYGDA
jgi:hypothetical protein